MKENSTNMNKPYHHHQQNNNNNPLLRPNEKIFLQSTHSHFKSNILKTCQNQESDHIIDKNITCSATNTGHENGFPAGVAMNVNKEEEEEGCKDDCGRERLKRHRVEVAGRVWIPDIWGQEELLKDWIDCSAFDASSLVTNRIMSARSALVEEGRRASSARLRIENRC